MGDCEIYAELELWPEWMKGEGKSDFIAGEWQVIGYVAGLARSWISSSTTRTS